MINMLILTSLFVTLIVVLIFRESPQVDDHVHILQQDDHRVHVHRIHQKMPGFLHLRILVKLQMHLTKNDE